MKLKDIKQGKTLWVVHVSYYYGLCVRVRKFFVTARVGTLIVCRDEIGNYHELDAVECNLVPDGESLNQVFRSLRAAQRYSSRMRAECHTVEEAAKAKRQISLAIDRWFDGH